MSTHEKLSAASNDRKARLAQLKSLKRKQPSSDSPQDAAEATPSTAPTAPDTDAEITPPTYLSGRNFDPATRNVRLGFEHTPIADPTSTLEYQAAQLALATKMAAAQESASAPLDLFRLQPKKPNWDLKRDLEEKMREAGLLAETERMVGRLVRERVVRQKEGEGDGGELVGGLHVREAEAERERREEEKEES